MRCAWMNVLEPQWNRVTRALPPENDSNPAVPGVESHGSVAMQGPNGVTSQQEASLNFWERTEAAPQGWATHLRQAMVPIQDYRGGTGTGPQF